MNQSCGHHQRPSTMDSRTEFLDQSRISPQLMIIDALIPGFSVFSTGLHKYTGVDLQLYIPAVMILALLIFAWSYIRDWLGEFVSEYLMSTADIRIDDEMYNMLMSWIAKQNFAKRSRHFVATTNLNSRMWWLFQSDDDDDADEDGEMEDIRSRMKGKSEKKVQFTPSFGTHYFWYKGRPMIFRRVEDTRQTGFGPVSERENISISSFGRNTELLKELLDECRLLFSKNDENHTVIYRGGIKSGSTEPEWTRCVSRVSRPFSTVVLDESVKDNLVKDMDEYLSPKSRRWYSNRGIPYRRGYLLYGPPGTGKSSLSFAIAGYFHLKIYIVSLNSMAMNEETLGTLFAALPKHCVVLLEDIDTAGLTHTRDTTPVSSQLPVETPTPVLPQNIGNGSSVASPSGRISLSALLNIIDGVAATEGRILIMTTNHLDQLDDALIRPGRVDLVVKFDLADSQMIASIFRSIFATLEADDPKPKPVVSIRSPKAKKPSSEISKEDIARVLDEKEAEARSEIERLAEEARIQALGDKIATLIPSLTFSPAEIQGYFLKWKRQPDLAVENATEWVEKTITDKKKRDLEERDRLEKEALEKDMAEREEKIKAGIDKKETAGAEEKKEMSGGADENKEALK